MQLKIKIRDNSEVAAATTKTPVQFGIFVRVGSKHSTIGRYDIETQYVVKCQTEASRNPAEAAAQCQATDTRVRNGTGGGNEPEFHRVVIHVGEQAATGHIGNTSFGIDPYATQRTQIDHHAAIAGRFAGETVPAAFNGDEEIRFSRKVDGVFYVRQAFGLHDQCRVAVDGRVQYPARFLVHLVARQHQVAAQAVSKLLYGCLFQSDLCAIAGDGVDIRINTHGATQDGRQTLACW